MLWWGKGDFQGSVCPRGQLLSRTVVTLDLKALVAEGVELSPCLLPNHSYFFLSVIRYIDRLFKIIIELVNVASEYKTQDLVLHKFFSNCIAMTIRYFSHSASFYISSFNFLHPPFSSSLSSVQDS